MRISIVTDTFYPQINGVSSVVFQSARGLSARGHDISIVAPRYEYTRTHAYAHSARLSVKSAPSIPLPAYPGERGALPLGFGIRALRTWKPDIIHMHTPFALGWEAIAASTFFGIPLVGTHHTFFDHYTKHIRLSGEWIKRASWKYVTAVYNRCSAVISPTHALAESLASRGLSVPYQILANPVDTDLFAPASDNDKRIFRKNIGVDGRVLAYMGRVSYEKSIDRIIRAMPAIIHAIPDCSLMIIGDGPEREALKRLAGTLGVNHRVRFLGFKHGRDLANTLRAADAFVTASTSENMPISILEAMAAGLPVCAPRLLGIPEVICHDSEGILVEPDNNAALCEGIIFIFSDSDRRARYGAAARRRAEAYAATRHAEELERLYQPLVSS